MRLVSLGFRRNGTVLDGHVRGSMPGAPGAPGGGMPKGGGGIWPGRPFWLLVLFQFIEKRVCMFIPGKPKGGGKAPGTIAGLGRGWPSAA